MKKKRFAVLLLSFLIPCGLMLLMLALHGVMPFGSRTILVGDANGQYVPFAFLLRRILRGGGSLLYTWRVGFGTGLLPEIAYYCANLYDLAACLLPEAVITPFLTVSVCTRLGTAGLFFAVFLMTVQRGPSYGQAVFAWMYALCGWCMPNCFQLIWLDCFALTPLVLAGLIRLVRDRDARLYLLSLFACLFCNYYFSFSICCMAVLFWIGLLIVLKRPLKSLPRECVRFFGSSLLAGGLAAVLLIPTAAALRSTTAAGMTFTDWDVVYEPFTLLLAQLAPFGRLHINQHPVNFTAGFLPLLCCFGFLTERKIALRERLCTAVLLLLLLASLWWAPLNVIWHGFHEPRFTVDRFAYFVPLILCCSGWRFVSVQTKAPRRGSGLLRICGMLLTAGGALYCALLHAEIELPLLTFVMLAVYGICFVMFVLMPKRRSMCAAFAAFCAAFELALNVNGTFLTVRQMPEPMQTAEITRALELVCSDAAAADGENLDRNGLRTEPTSFINKGLLFDLPYGTSAFSSMNTAGILNFCQKCGMVASPIGADYAFQELSPFCMQLLGVSYMVTDESVQFGTPLSEDDGSTVRAYRSGTERTAGFCIPLRDSCSLDAQADVYKAQNQMFAEMTGTDMALYSQVMPQLERAMDLTVTQTAEDTFAYVPADPDTDPAQTHPNLYFAFEIPEDGAYYAFYAVGQTEWEGYEVWRGETQIAGSFYEDPMQQFYHPTAVLGRLEQGETLHFQFYPKRSASGTLRLYIVRLDEEVCAEGLSRLTAHALREQHITDTSLSGTVTAEQDSLLYIAVPFDKGWCAAVDGKPAETEPVYGAMTGIRISAGTHQIQMRFFPRGLTAGCIVSAVSLLILLIWLPVTGHQIRKRRRDTVPPQT
ncbi:MAG: YfhO family protein [Oscillospiraceae bacterium]|nr:YfhO family protein [Oscillospiraceae bacterium]